MPAFDFHNKLHLLLFIQAVKQWAQYLLRNALVCANIPNVIFKYYFCFKQSDQLTILRHVGGADIDVVVVVVVVVAVVVVVVHVGGADIDVVVVVVVVVVHVGDGVYFLFLLLLDNVWYFYRLYVW